MRLRVGTSGFSYKEWKGAFYPEDLPATKMLAFYSNRFDAVEINGTFYRAPTQALVDGWKKEVGASFAFALKAPMRLSYLRRVPAAEETARSFFATVQTLGKKLGPVLLHVPKHVKKDVALLDAFFELVPKGLRIAVELDHPSWSEDDEVRVVLAAHGAARVVVDDPTKPPPDPRSTSTFGYFRLRRASYSDAALARWIAMISAEPITDAWVFFKHEDEAKGPRFAERFRKQWEKARELPEPATVRGRGRTKSPG